VCVKTNLIQVQYVWKEVNDAGEENCLTTGQLKAFLACSLP
jgi:hypothetical protein